MIVLFALTAAVGFSLLVMLPVYKNRFKRLASQSAGTSIMAVGLFGLLFQIMV